MFLEISQNFCNFIKKEALVQVFSPTFCEIFKKTFSTEHPETTASEFRRQQFHKTVLVKWRSNESNIAVDGIYFQFLIF